MKSLIIIRTPFQALYAERIIKYEQLPKQNVLIIFLYSCDNFKAKEYGKRLEVFAHKIWCIKLPDTKNILMNIFRHLYIFTFAFLNKKKLTSERLYFASVDSIPIQTIASHASASQFISFDDGSANYTDTYINKNQSNSRLYRISKLFGNRFNQNQLLKSINLHYCLWSDGCKFGCRKIELDLYEEQNSDIQSAKRTELNIFLGTVYSAITNDVSYIESKVTNLLSVDLYIRHPRSKDLFFKEKRLDSNFIFEDFVIQKLSEYKNINVFCFPSTCILSLRKFERIKFFCLDSKYIHNKEFLAVASDLCEEVINID